MTSPGTIENTVRDLASRVAASLGVEIVEVCLRGGGSRRVLRIDIDRPGASGVKLDDCKQVSDAIGVALDEREDLIPFGYLLEVSSPGADRPIRTPDDIRRNTGRRVLVSTSEPIGGSRSHRGVLLGCEQDCLVLAEGDAPPVRLPLNGVVDARQELEL